MPTVFVDRVASPPHGKLTPFNAYVALSRAKTSSNIRLLRDFDDKLFTQHPSEFLQIEDERLDGLDKETREKDIQCIIQSSS